MSDGHNGYTPSPGVPEAREAVARDFTARGVPTDPDRVLLTSGTSEGIELTLGALLNEGDEVLVPSPTYPLYTAVIAKLEARALLPDGSGARVAAGSRSPARASSRRGRGRSS